MTTSDPMIKLKSMVSRYSDRSVKLLTQTITGDDGLKAKITFLELPNTKLLFIRDTIFGYVVDNENPVGILGYSSWVLRAASVALPWWEVAIVRKNLEAYVGTKLIQDEEWWAGLENVIEGNNSYLRSLAKETLQSLEGGENG